MVPKLYEISIGESPGIKKKSVILMISCVNHDEGQNMNGICEAPQFVD